MIMPNFAELSRAFRDFVFDLRALLCLAATTLVLWLIPASWLPAGAAAQVDPLRVWAELVFIASAGVSVAIHGGSTIYGALKSRAQNKKWEAAAECHLSTLNLDEIRLVAFYLLDKSRTIDINDSQSSSAKALCGKGIFANYEGGTMQIPNESWSLLTKHRAKILADDRLPPDAEAAAIRQMIDRDREEKHRATLQRIARRVP